MGREKRRAFWAEKKAEVLRRHLVDKIPVSNLCDGYKIQPGLFYNWRRQMTANLSAALQDGRSTSRSDGELQMAQARIVALEAKLARKDAIIADISEEHLQLKNAWGGLNGRWVQPDVRDAVINFLERWSEKTELAVFRLLGWIGVPPGKFYRWKQAYGSVWDDLHDDR